MTRADRHPDQMSETVRQKQRRLGCQTILILITALLAIVGVTCLWLWREEPEYWQQYQAMLASTRLEDRQQLAETLEKTLLAAIDPETAPDPESSEVGSDDSGVDKREDIRHLRIEIDQINAWLETKLARWLAHTGRSLPNQIRGLMVAIDDGTLVLAFEVTSPELEQITSLFLDVHMIGDPIQPQLRVLVSRVKAGKLPVPRELLIKHLRKYETRKNIYLLESIAGTIDGNIFDPILPMPGDDRHLIRLLDVDLGNESLDLTIRIESID